MRERRLIIVLATIATVLCVFLCITEVYDQKIPRTLGTIRLNIETYLAGKNQPTHPSVVVFREPWNGAKYWLAYSPYPYGNGEEENPCIAVSDDLLFWKTPNKLANPIANNEETGCNELKDPHLLYRDDLDRLEIWYLGRLGKHLGGDGTSLLLFRKYSYDGSNWSEYEVMSKTKYLSPTVIWDGTKYRMWGIGFDVYDTEGTIVYQESIDGVNWSFPMKCSLGDKQSNIDIWHGSVVQYKDGYQLVYIDATSKQDIFFCSARDGINFGIPERIVENNGYWDFLYRPTLVYSNNEVYCLYGVVNDAKQWFISMSRGKDTHCLYGINESVLSEMNDIPNDEINTKSIGYKIRKLYDAVQLFLRIELAVLAAAEACLMLVFGKIRKSNVFVVICSYINVMLTVGYIVIRMQPYGVVNWIGVCVATCILNIGLSATLKCIQVFLCEVKYIETKSA